jgi:hypothetical protein
LLSKPRWWDEKEHFCLGRMNSIIKKFNFFLSSYLRASAKSFPGTCSKEFPEIFKIFSEEDGEETARRISSGKNKNYL